MKTVIMKKNIFFFISFLLLTQLSEAQQKEINSYSDLPVINYSTAMLKTGDKARTDAWMKTTAARELLQCDSIFQRSRGRNILH